MDENVDDSQTRPVQSAGFLRDSSPRSAAQAPLRFAVRSAAGLLMGALSFTFLILVVNPIQMASMVIYPFSREAFRAVNRSCAATVWGWWVWMAYVQNRIDIRFRGDRLPREEDVLIISNHQSMADVLLLMCVAHRCGRLPDMKWFVKDSVKYVPGPGWGMYFLDCLFVTRNWARDQVRIQRMFSKYLEHRIPVFIVSFLEGTRRTEAKTRSSQAFAERSGLYVPQQTLLPRTKGFVATLGALREHLDAVYDVTIAYPERVPSLLDCFACRVVCVEVRVERHSLSELPTDDEALAAWALERFREKDQMLIDFQTNQVLPGVRLTASEASTEA